jgi:serine-aspartate repeat-containing protein C/D/E
MDINSYNINRFEGDVFENVLGGLAKRDIQYLDYNDSDYYSNSDSSSIKNGGVNIFESDEDDEIETSEYMITSDNDDVNGGLETSEYMILSDNDESPNMDNEISEYYEIDDDNKTNDINETDDNKETDEINETSDNSDNHNDTNNETNGGSNNTEHIFIDNFKKMLENL